LGFLGCGIQVPLLVASALATIHSTDKHTTDVSLADGVPPYGRYSEAAFSGQFLPSLYSGGVHLSSLIILKIEDQTVAFRGVEHLHVYRRWASDPVAVIASGSSSSEPGCRDIGRQKLRSCQPAKPCSYVDLHDILLFLVMAKIAIAAMHECGPC
jgi:hypothetical protein